MMRISRVTLTLAAIAFVPGVLLFAFSDGDGGMITGVVFLIIGVVLVIGALAGAGAEIGLRKHGLTATGDVTSVVREDQRRPRSSEYLWIVRVRYQDRNGAFHEGDVEASAEEAEFYRDQKRVTVRYNPERPDVFIVID